MAEGRIIEVVTISYYGVLVAKTYCNPVAYVLLYFEGYFAGSVSFLLDGRL